MAFLKKIFGKEKPKSEQEQFLSACYDGDLSLAQSVYSANNGVINCSDDNGRTPLMLSLSGNEKHISRWLLSLDTITVTSCNNANNTALHVASACNSDRDIVMGILARGGSGLVSMKSRQGETALDLAVERNNKHAVECISSVQGVHWELEKLKGIAR